MAVGNGKNAYPSPFLKASFPSKFFFWWLKDIIWYGKTQDAVGKDLYDTIPDDFSAPLTCNLESVWTKEVDNAYQRNNKPSLWKVFMRLYFWDFIKLTIFPIGFIVMLTVQPLLLDMMMSYFRINSTMSPQWAYANATIFIFSMILPSAFLCHGLFHLNRLGMRARIACTSLIYKKMIRLPSSTNQTMGNSVISLLTIDATKLEYLFSYAPFIVIVPIQLLVVVCLIWDSIDFITAAAGVGLMMLQTFPVQMIYSKITLKFRAKQAISTDNRVFLIDEIINGIKAIKMYVWETYLEKLVYSARKLEIANYMKISYVSSLVWSCTAVSHRLCAFAVMLVYGLRHGMITVDKILPVTQHLFNLQSSICIFFFVAVRSITDMHVSIKRIQDFLLLQEANLYNESIEENTGSQIIFKGVTASWNKTSVLFENFSLDFAPNKGYAVVGSVGSGKSSLLKLILGELQTVSGKISVRGRLSYASQEPWLFNNSVRENILFGEVYDKKRYDNVVKACALSDDFKQWPYGDETLVGDRGSNLSGGQCARINLARSVYREAEIYLLDDPLSAVDIQVAKQIMNNCINTLLVDKTRILATHHVQQLGEMDTIIFLEHGRVVFRGNMEDFQRSNQYTSQVSVDEVETSEETTKKLEINQLSITDKKDINNLKKEPKVADKSITEGALEQSVYLSYIKAGSWKLVSLVILANLLFVMSVATFDFGLGAWTKTENTFLVNETENNSTILIKIISTLNSSFVNKTIYTFGGLLSLIIFTSIMRNMFLYKFALNAGKNIHNSIFSRMMTATLPFFESNSAGKVLNRFSEDTGIVDNVLSHTLFNAINTTFDIIAFFLPAILANWWILIACTISITLSVLIGRVYVRAVQKIKRLAGSAKSPILSFAASSLAGVTTIRACRAENIVVNEFNSRQDRQTAAQFLTVASAPAFSFWIELINLGLLASITYLCIFLKNDDSYEGYVGLSLMQILSITENMSFTANQTAEVFGHMTSVERMLQFTKLEQETLNENKACFEMSSSWPQKGEIMFKNLYLKYSNNSEPTLWDLNFTVEPGSKIGIVGRTGAGKSSFISTLFRFTEFQGTLLIDGIDVKTVDLYKLRSKISIIPQEPLLLKSSLRKNLDPFDKFEDATLWSALENVELKKNFDSLECPIEKGGNNLSVGQRQLLCLARAIINNNKILILDEATANVDSATDTLIQATIRSKFINCTVLTIAHRLNTVADSDKILVMDNGRITEYDHPFVLLQNTNSYFFKMVQQMSDKSMQNLRNIAEKAYYRLEKHNQSFNS